MSHRWNTLMRRVPQLATAAAVVALSATAALAQSAPAAGAAPTAAWIKQCATDPQTKKQVCVTAQELRAETNQFIAGLQFRKADSDPKITVTAMVLTGQLLQQGLRMQVDDGKPVELKYMICDQSVCLAQGQVDDAFIATMKKGTRVASMTLNGQGKPMMFPFSLAGFTKAYEGPGLDAAAMQAKRDELQKRLQQSADQNRQKLIDQQNKELNNSGN